MWVDVLVTLLMAAMIIVVLCILAAISVLVVFTLMLVCGKNRNLK